MYHLGLGLVGWIFTPLARRLALSWLSRERGGRELSIYPTLNG